MLGVNGKDIFFLTSPELFETFKHKQTLKKLKRRKIRFKIFGIKIDCRFNGVYRV